jgi:hypothetical protein
MRIITLTVIILIALYTLLINVGVLPENQLVWLSSSYFFYSVFLPLLMLLSALTALVKKRSINIFFLSLGAMVIDAINRLAIAVDHIYFYYRYKDVPVPLPPPGTTMIRYNYWPSHIMLVIELALILAIIIWLRRNKFS